ncbi:MAG: BMP family ABC transporter substrate-binding protein [Caldilineaceae bacterium]
MQRNRMLVWLSLLLTAMLVLAACGGGEEPAAETPSEAPAAAATTAPAASADAESEGPLQVAFVYVAPIGDLGWSWAHDQGRKYLESEMGDGVETAFVENVPEGPDAERVIRDFAQRGYDLIITTSFGYMDPTLTVAEEFPDTHFVHISGFKTAPNMSTAFGRMYQPRYLSGLVAGSMTESNIVGYVAAFPIPEVIRGINAFTLGVKEANPDAEVRVVWTNTWFGPPQEKEAAEALLDQGADVIAQHQDTTEPQKAAADRGAYGISYNSPMLDFVGDAVLTGPVWNWGPVYLSFAESVLDGSWESQQLWGGLDTGLVDLAPYSPNVPEDVIATVDAAKAAIAAGETDVFCGPLTGQNGVEFLPAGQCMTDAQMLNMDWFVDGVVGDAPGEAAAIEGQPAPEAAAPAAETPAAAEEAMSGDMPKVAFVYVGPVGDLGWSYAHDQGRIALEEMGVETAYSELVAEGPDAARVLRTYANEGYNLIFATSFGYMDSVLEVAAEFPDVKFEHATGYQTADNVGIYDGRGYQGWYLAGMVAGEMTESNVLGYIAPYPIAEVVRNLNAFALGAQSVNPDVEVRPVWIFSWFDPPSEREAAQALIDAGADVVARESDSVEPDKLAEEAGVYAIGYNAISNDVAPNAVLTAPIWDWSVIYEQKVQDVADGAWTNEPVWWGMAEGVLDLAPIADFVPEEVKTAVEVQKAAIIAGDFQPFCGPINDNAGEARVAEGECMDDGALLSFDWLVEGVTGEIPQ